MKGFHFLVAILCSKKVQDTQCGFKLFTRATAEILFRTLHIEGWAFDVELIYVAESLGVSIKEVFKKISSADDRVRIKQFFFLKLDRCFLDRSRRFKIN